MLMHRKEQKIIVSRKWQFAVSYLLQSTNLSPSSDFSLLLMYFAVLNVWLPCFPVIVAALCNRAGHYIFALWFLSSSSSTFFYFFFFFSSPNLSGRRLDVYHTSTHGLSENLECTSEMFCNCTRLGENTGCKKSPFGHHCTTVGLYLRN